MPPIVIDNDSGKIIVELQDGDVIVAQSDVEDRAEPSEDDGTVYFDL